MKKNILTGVLVVLGTVTGAFADRLTLKSGSLIDGSYIGGNPRQIQMEVDGQIRSFDVQDVKSITFGDTSYQSRGTQTRPQEQLSTRPPSPPREQVGDNFGGFTIPADTSITIRTIDAVNSETARRGQTFQASLDEPIYVDGRQVVPRGADVLTKIVSDQKAGKLQGQTSLTLALSQISINGRYVDVTSTDVQTNAASQTGRTAKVVGGTAALGAIVGAIAGGGKGAAIGAGSGAALGGATQVFTSGPQVKIPPETRLTFRLQAPVQF